MTEAPSKKLELPISERGLLALKVAVKKLIEEHARQGLTLYVWRNGEVMEVPAAELREEAAPLEEK